MIKNTYERDFTAWADEQALLLEQQRWQELDLEQCYLDAREDASDETNLELDVFPIYCPYSIFQLRDRNF